MKSDMITEGFLDRLSASQLPYRERAEGYRATASGEGESIYEGEGYGRKSKSERRRTMIPLPPPVTNSFDVVQEIPELEEGPGTLVPGPAQFGFFKPDGPAGGGQRERDHAQVFRRLDEVLEREQ